MEGLGVVCSFAVGLLLFAAWTLLIFATKPKRFLLLWLGVPVLSLIALVCLAFGLAAYRSLPGVVYRDSVGLEPTPDVTVVHSLRHEPTDWDDSYLEFYASDATIDSIIQKGFAPVEQADIEQFETDPDWWKPPVGPKVGIFATKTNDPQFRDKDFRYFLSQRLMIYDRGSGDASRRKVYFRYRH